MSAKKIRTTSKIIKDRTISSLIIVKTITDVLTIIRITTIDKIVKRIIVIIKKTMATRIAEIAIVSQILNLTLS